MQGAGVSVTTQRVGGHAAVDASGRSACCGRCKWEVFVAGKETWEASCRRVHAWESQEGQLLFWPFTGHVGGRWPRMGKGLAAWLLVSQIWPKCEQRTCKNGLAIGPPPLNGPKWILGP